MEKKKEIVEGLDNLTKLARDQEIDERIEKAAKDIVKNSNHKDRTGRGRAYV